MQELDDRRGLDNLFEQIVSQAEETVVITDGEIASATGPVIQYMNAAAEQRTGYRKEALIGQPLSLLVLPDLWPAVHAQLLKVRETGKAAQIELRAKDSNGKEYWMELSTVPMFGAQGELEHFVRIGREVTSRKHAEQQREMTQRLLASVFGVMETALVVTNEAGAVIMANAALSRRFGWGVFDTIGQPVARIVAEADRARFAAELTAGGSADQPRQLAFDLLHKDGTLVPVTAQVIPVESPTIQDFYLITLQPADDAQSASLSAGIRRVLDRADGSAQVVAGKLQLVGMTELRNELGPRWTELSERAFGIAHQVIRKHLQSTDICKRSANDGFLVFFHDLAEADAQTKARLIGEEIRDRLLGEIPEMSAARVSSFAANVSIGKGEAESEEALLDVLSSRLESERQQIERAAHEKIKGELRNARPLLQPGESADGQQVPVLMARLPASLQGALDTVRSLGQSQYAVDADLFILAGAGQYALSAVSRGKSGLVLVPLKYSTASGTREFELWLKAARALGDASKNQLVVEITEIPRAVLRSRLADIAMRLAPLFRSTAFELPNADSAFAVGLPMSTRLATISVRQLMHGDAVSHDAANRLTKLLDARQCRVIAKDVAGPAQVQALAAAGIQLMFAETPPSA